MITLTTITKNGEVHKQESKPKRFRPLDGWERQKDGSFIRKLDDPRWISMQEIRNKIQQRKVQSVQTERVQDTEYVPKHVYCQTKYNRLEFLSMLKFRHGSFDGPKISLSDVTIQKAINCSGVKIGDTFLNVTIDFSEKIIYFQQSRYSSIMKVYNLVHE